MALGRRKREQQEAWVATNELPKSPGHVFYRKLNELLREADFDRFAEALCRPYYAEVILDDKRRGSARRTVAQLRFLPGRVVGHRIGHCLRLRAKIT